MRYLAVTINSKDKKTVEVIKNRFSRYSNTMFRVYKSQIKLDATESKKWTYLILMDVASEIESNKIKYVFNIPEYLKKKIIRIETFEDTKKNIIRKSLFKNGTTMIEHVNVQKRFLNEFKEIMIKNNIPAMDYIIQNKTWCNEFFNLETNVIIYHNEKYTNWNQLHLINLTYSAPFHYKKDFSEGLKKEGIKNFEENFARLSEIRNFTYKYKTKKIQRLSV